MFVRFAALGDLPAGEGFGAVLGVALNGLLALALIFGVLMIMDRVHEGKNTDPERDETKAEEQFPQKGEIPDESGNDPNIK